MSRLPELAASLGPLAFRAGIDQEVAGAFTVGGRRILARGDGHGIRRIDAHPFHVTRGPRATSAEPAPATVTPLGAERVLSVDGRAVRERIVASRDAPVVWVEWIADGATGLELEWTVAARDPTTVPVAWRAEGRALWLTLEGGAGPRAGFVLSADPESFRVAPDDDGGVRVRAGVTVPGEAGLRLAVVASREDDDISRLLRIAGRTAVAARARAGAADRILKEGLRVTTADPALGPAIDRARIDLAFRPVEPTGPWTATGLADDALDRLAAGYFDSARAVVDFLFRWVSNDGITPAQGVGSHVTGWGDPAAGPLTLLLPARYLAWTGDLAGVRGWWPAALRAVEAGEARGGVARELAVVAQELGDAEAAGRLSAERTERSSPAPELQDGPAPSGSIIRQVVHEVLGAEPDAPRGRLVLRPRPTGDRLEVRGLAVGRAAVNVVYQRDGGRHRMDVRQERGPLPLQLVLEPELPGRRVAAVRVDGVPAELDITDVDAGAAGHAEAKGTGARRGRGPGRRWRVPVQLALDGYRTLEVEMDGR